MRAESTGNTVIFTIKGAAGILAWGGPCVSRWSGAQLACLVHPVQILVNRARVRVSQLERICVCHLAQLPSTCPTISFTLSLADFTNRAFSQIFSLGPTVASETFLTLLFTGMTSPNLEVIPELRSPFANPVK